jgi:hypothetical protein
MLRYSSKKQAAFISLLSGLCAPRLKETTAEAEVHIEVVAFLRLQQRNFAAAGMTCI